MRRDRRRLSLGLLKCVAFFAALSLVAGGLASCGTPAPPPAASPQVIKETVVVRETVEVAPEPKEPIIVGMSFAYTGPTAWVGEEVTMGLTLGMEEVNAEGGVLGHPIQLVSCDEGTSLEGSIACIRRLVEEQGADVIVGSSGSGGFLAQMPIAEEYGVPLITVTCSSAKITEGAGVGGNEWVFRVGAHDGLMGEAFAAYIGEQGVESASFIAVNNDWGRGGVESTKPFLEAAGVEVLSEDYVELGQPDYRPLITRLKSVDPEAVFALLFARDAGVFVRQKAELGFPATIFCRGGWPTPSFDEAVSDDLSMAEGITDCSQTTVSADPDLAQRYVDRWGREAHWYGVAYHAAVRYVIPQAAEIAIEETGEITRSSLRDALEKVSIDTPLFGLIEFDDHHQAHPMAAIQQFQNGEWVLIEMVPTD